jgi:hypothetical protein
MVVGDNKIEGDKKYRWITGDFDCHACSGTTRGKSPDGAHPGLYWKPLDATRLEPTIMMSPISPLPLTPTVNIGVELPPQRFFPSTTHILALCQYWFYNDSNLVKTSLCKVKNHFRHWIDLTTNPPIRTIRESLSQSNSMVTRSRQHRQEWLCQSGWINSKHYQLTD